MTGRMKTALFLLAAATLAAGAAFAQGGGFPGMMGGGGPGHPGGGMGGFGPENLGAFRMLSRQLDLTDVQMEEIETILEETRERIETILDEAGAPGERPRFLEVFAAGELTTADLEEAFPGTDEVRDAIRGVTFEGIVAIHDVLTAGQLAQLAEIAEAHADMGPGCGCGMMGSGMAPCPEGGLPR